MKTCWILIYPGYHFWKNDVSMVIIVYPNPCRKHPQMNHFVFNSGLQDYCPWESFNAKCQKNEVIVMEVARYGRMRLGRCVKNDLGYVGCFSDVIQILDSKCSGIQTATSIAVNMYLFQCKPFILKLSPKLSPSLADWDFNWQVHLVGRHECELAIPDPDLDELQPCLEDLKSYLETAYKCVPG